MVAGCENVNWNPKTHVILSTIKMFVICLINGQQHAAASTLTAQAGG